MSTAEQQPATLWNRLYQLEVNAAATAPDTTAAAPFRFSAQLQLDQPDSDREQQQTAHVINTQQIGLFQVMTALPDHYLDLMLKNQHTNDNTMRDFIHMFNQHWIALCYLAWSNSRPYLDHGLDANDNAYRQQMCAISGQTASTSSALHHDSRLYYAGLLRQRHLSARQLGQLLQDYFQIPVTVLQNQGQWLAISDHEQWRMPAAKETGERILLGINSHLGQRSWDCQYKLRIQLGPLTLTQYNAMLPGTRAHQQCLEWIRRACPAHMSFDLQLRLHQDHVPNWHVSKQRLGYNTWLHQGHRQQHVNPLTLGDFYVNA